MVTKWRLSTVTGRKDGTAMGEKPPGRPAAAGLRLASGWRI